MSTTRCNKTTTVYTRVRPQRPSIAVREQLHATSIITWHATKCVFGFGLAFRIVVYKLLEKMTKCGSITWLKLTNGYLPRTTVPLRICRVPSSHHNVTRRPCLNKAYFSGFWVLHFLKVCYGTDFFPRDVVSAVYATATWVAGWVSVTCRGCIKTAKPIFKKTFSSIW